MLIRLAQVSDMDALLRIGHDFYQYNPYKAVCGLDQFSLETTLTQMILDDLLYVVEADGEVHGAAGAIMAPLYWNHAFKQALELFWWVDPPYRGGGTAKELRAVLEAQARFKGASVFNMVALESSDPERVGALYKKAGYSPVEHVYMKVF